MSLRLVRIDDRLIHGQVVAGWLRALGAQRIVIVDDAAARDEFLREVLSLAAPSGVPVEVLDLVGGAARCIDLAASQEPVIVLARSPRTVLALRQAGVPIEVVDLGVDVPPEKFVEAIARHKPQVVGMSVLLTTCFKSVLATVEAIRQAGHRQKVSIMVGGAAASELLREAAGGDFYGRSAVDGVKFADSVVGAC